VAAALQLTRESNYDALEPADAHGFRGEQNPHRPRRL
jgi:hypothetical protein